jgi:hypothetical protein
MMGGLLTIGLFTRKQGQHVPRVIVYMRNLFDAFHVHVRDQGIIDLSAIWTFEIGQVSFLLFLDFME